MAAVFKFIWRGAAAILAVALLLTAIWVVRLQLGWVEPPAEAPLTAQTYDPAYAEAGEAAGLLLAAMRERTGVPGGGAAVSVDGRLVWSAGAGFAELQGLTPVTPDTSFRIGSTSKPMTATVLARLAAAGTLSLDDTVGAHWPEPLNPAWAPLILRRLMSHTSGMPGYEDNTDYRGLIGSMRMQRRFDSVEEGLSLVDGSRLAYAQGDDFLYSSFDVNLAARTAESATGQSYDRLLADLVTGPLGLETPYLDDHGAAPVPEASWHQISRGRARLHPHADVSQRWPGGGLAARPADLVQVAGAWLDEAFIPRALAEDFWVPVRLNDGSVNEQNYAVGWRSDLVATRFGEGAPVRMVHHGGVSRGAMSWLALYPDLGIAVAVNINAETPEFNDFASVEPEILRLFAAAAGRTPEGATPPSLD